MLENVEWREILESTGKYLISNLGEVLHKRKNRIVRPWVNNNGYQMVSFTNKDKKVVHRAIHRLVMENFSLNPDQKPQVNHKDGIKTNNHLSNLEWVTQSENQNHAVKYKLQPGGEQKPNAKLNTKIVLYIRNLYKTNKLGYRNIAKLIKTQYNIEISYALVRQIIKREIWKGVECQ